MTPHAVANHLWQSTLFVLLAAGVAWALRNHRASVRFWVWMAASVKFLVPFSLLIEVGRTIEPPRQAAAAIPVAMKAATEQIAEPFLMPLQQTREIPFAAIWITGSALIAAYWLLQWLRLYRIARAARPLAIASRIPVRATEAKLEPGVFGIFRPVLLMPRDLLDRLTPEQLQAILAHEHCHVRRRDNLLAAIQMGIQVLFWFQPLVWWIGKRLADERELACDEAVVAEGNEPRDYAEGILTVCKHYLRQPSVACAAGISGADLRTRISAIMQGASFARLSASGIAAIAFVALCAVLAPVVVGTLKAQQPPRFDVASIKLAAPNQRGSGINPGPNGGLRLRNLDVRSMITFAYDIRQFQLSGGPAWVSDDRYDVLASSEGDQPVDRNAKPDFNVIKKQMELHRIRLQSLLAERFQLVLRKEEKELPIYALVVTKGGHKMKVSNPETSGGPHMRTNNGSVQSNRMPVQALVTQLASLLGRKVIDATGLSGDFDYELTWTPEPGMLGGKGAGEAPPEPTAGGGSIFTSLQEQLGLKLETRKGPVDVYVIEKIQKPSEN